MEESFEASHEMSPDSFVKLQRRDDEPCFIEITFNDPNLKITDISIVSEAKFIELYGKFGEYIKTVRADPLDTGESEDSAEECYCAYSDCPTSKELGIKFAGLKEKSSIWIYGIKLLAVKSSPAATHVDYSNVNERLKSSALPLSEKAEKCKQFLQNYSKLVGNEPPIGQRPSDQQLFMQMMAGQFPDVLTKMGLPHPGSDSVSGTPSEPPQATPPDMTQIKGYIDDKLDTLEKRVMDNLEKQLKDVEMKQDAKLDSIIHLLTLQRSGK